MVIDRAQSEALFKRFVQADSFTEITESFKQVCDSLDIDNNDYTSVYGKLKEVIRTDDVCNLCSLLDKRANQEVYGDGTICNRQKVFVIGAGPCGLRMAIEARLLGSQVVVVEMRSYVTRNNVLHLWPSVIHDLKSLGAKIFYRKFCTGSLDHISIRKLQSVLLKIALVLGVEVHAPVTFLGVNEPTDTSKGWTAQLEPSDHPASQYEFDFIVGADGKRNSLNGFKRKCFRAKQAIAITFNLVNNRTKADNQVEEIPGLFYIFAQEYFNNMKEKAGIDLENIVYFRDETHYFVMTAKKPSLLKRKVLKQDMQDSHALLSWDNINRDEILSYARDAAELATNNKMPTKEFAKNHHGDDDIAIFDFTAMYQCEYSTLIREKHGHDLVMTIVGDGLVEPFWPTGSGAGRGFLSVLDAAWLLRMRGLGRDPLECLAEKETIFQILQQAAPNNLKQYNKHTIDPASRYRGKTGKLFLRPEQVKHLYVTHDQVLENIPDIIPRKVPTPALQRKKTTKRSQSHDTATLLNWYQDKLSGFKESFTIENLDTSWKDGLALCALVFLHRPKLLGMKELKAENAHENIQMALDLIHKEFGLESLVTPDDIINECGDAVMNKLILLSYLGQLQEYLLKDSIVSSTDSSEPPAKKVHQQAASVVLMELTHKEPELMGMGKKIPSGVTKNAKTTKTTKTREKIREKFAEGTGKTLSVSKFGDPHRDSEEDEINACSGIAMRRIKETESKIHGKFVQKMDMPERKTETLSSVPLRGSVRDQETPSSGESGDSPWNRDSVMGQGGLGLTLDSFKQQFSKTFSEVVTKPPSDLCQVCSKPMYQVERTQANGFCLHKSCLRCSVCRCTLRIGNSHAQLPEGQTLALLYCFRHAYEAGLFSAVGGASSRRETDLQASSVAKQVGDDTEQTGVEDSVDVKESSSEDEFLDAEDTTDGIEVQMRNRGAAAVRPESEHRQSTSVRLMMAQEIQDGLEEVDSEEKELEERGKQVEETIKNQRPGTPIADDAEIMDEFMDVMKKKQELKEKESKLVLQMKLLWLQERQKQLLAETKASIEQLQGSAEMEEVLERLDKDTSSLEANMNAIKDQIADLKLYLETDT